VSLSTLPPTVLGLQRAGLSITTNQQLASPSHSTSTQYVQDMRIITNIEVVYEVLLSQAGADNTTDICSSGEEQAQQRMLEAIGRLGVDRTGGVRAHAVVCAQRAVCM